MALELLQRLSFLEQKKILKAIGKKDPRIADFLAKNLVQLEDLALLTAHMLQTVLKEIDIKDLAFALRGEKSSKLNSFLAANLPRTMWQDVEEVLKGPEQKLSSVMEARERVVEVLRKKADRGEIIINRNPDDKFV